jgi:hypothetical protein
MSSTKHSAHGKCARRWCWAQEVYQHTSANYAYGVAAEASCTKNMRQALRTLKVSPDTCTHTHPAHVLARIGALDTAKISAYTLA